ncbi:MAG: transglutaminase family protein [Leptospirales bacterium]|nr:transglutaminase family protein [Leptospirales bacterium]
MEYTEDSTPENAGTTRYRVRHQTIYEYKEDVNLCHSEGRLLPRDLDRQRTLQASLRIQPGADFSMERSDYFGNRVSYFALQRPHRRLEAVAESIVELRPPSPPAHNPPWEEALRALQGPHADSFVFSEFRLDSPMAAAGLEYREYALRSFLSGRALLDSCQDLNARIHADFKYESGFSNVSTPLDVVFEHRRGVCQDFAHLFLACLRSLGFAGRYVSGYLETSPPPGKTKLQGADASHAWAAALFPGGQWLDFDPTNNLMPSTQHITLAWGRDYADITPLKGVIFGGGEHSVKVAVDVTRQ